MSSRYRAVVHALVIIVIISATLLALDRLVGLGELAQRREGVRAELVEDARHELGELLDLASAVDRVCVRVDGSVHYYKWTIMSEHVSKKVK